LFVKQQGVTKGCPLSRFKGGLDEKKFELPLDAAKMESQSKILIDKSYSFGYSGKDMSETITHTRIEDSETGTSHLWINRVETVSGITKSFDEKTENEVRKTPWACITADPRRFLLCTSGDFDKKIR